MYRIDASSALESPKRLPNGTLRADARLTRTGIFPYRGADGTIRRELRLPSEVFKADSLDTFAGAPFTDDHPEEMISAGNAMQFAKGTVGDGVKRDGDYVRAKVHVHDASTIGKIESGKVQLSCGYDCDLEFKPGVVDPSMGLSAEWTGKRYDAIQRNIVGNHVALVSRGRAGAGASIRMDAAIEVEENEPPTPPKAGEKKDKAMRKVKINGIRFDVEDSAADAIEEEQRAHADALKGVTTERDALKTKHDTERARADAAESAKANAEKARKDAEDPERMDAAIEARATLLTVAREHVGADYKIGKKSNRDVHMDVLAKLVPDFKADALAGESADYVRARFDLAVKDASAGALAKANRVASGTRPTGTGRKDAGGTGDAEADAKARMQARHADAWKGEDPEKAAQ